MSAIKLAATNDYATLDVFNTSVLVEVYIRPEKTKGGIFLPETAKKEDEYQSKVGRIVRMGADAFKDDDGKWFKGVQIGVGDWIVFRPSDGWAMTVNGTLCRMLSDMDVKARITSPDMVW